MRLEFSEMFKFKFVLLLIFSLLLIFAKSTLAVGLKNAVIVNPIRGQDFWEYKYGVLETPKKQYEIISANNLKATWLVRYDALKNSEVVSFLKSLNSQQEIGIFMEITPTLTKDASVNYNQSQSWHNSKSVLLIGYSPDDRIKLIDTVFKKYKEVFSKNPSSVGAWWIDAGSLSYMRKEYEIISNLDVSDQFSTDGYQVWGQYWSSPFYPSKVNALMPAQSESQKIGVVTLQWAPRDPFNGYGSGAFESTYSVQSNDYMLHDLGISYFEKLLNIYPELVVGLENDFDFSKFGAEYKRQLDLLSKNQREGKLSAKTMEEFSRSYISQYPAISPNVLVYADDPLGSGGKVVWWNTPRYRAGWFYGPEGSVIRDLRQLNDSTEEQCLKTGCESLKLGFSANQAIDEINFGTKWVLDEGKISDVAVLQNKKELIINYKNQAGVERKITFLENDIKVNDVINPISTAILNAVTAPKVNKELSAKNFKSEFDFAKNLPPLFAGFGKFLLLTVLFFFIPGFVLTRRLILSIPVGWALFALLSFIFGYLKIDLLIWALPVISFLAMIKTGIPRLPKVKFNRQNLGLLLLIITGSASWMVVTFKNGLSFNYGLGFWGPNGHDAIWHLALISELEKNIPPNNPIFAGEKLTNYHYFFDLLIAKSAILFSINELDLLFRFFPLLISLLIGVLVFYVARKISNNFFAGIFATFFVYFGGSFGYIISYFRDKSFGGETMFWAQQSISTLLNPPYAISVVAFLAGLWMFYQLVDQKGQWKRWIIPLTLVWGTLIEFKAYGGVLVIGALGILALEKLIVRRDLSYLKIFMSVAALSAIVFLPNNIGSASLFVFSPLWLVESMITFQDRLNWYRLSLTLQSGSVFKVPAAYMLGILIFFAGNLGTRIISLGEIKLLFRERLLFYMAAIGIIIPLLFIQQGNGWNIIQFFYYSLLIFSIFAGVVLGRFVIRVNFIWGLIISSIIILLTVPTTLNTFSQYLPERPPAKLSSAEFEALSFLKNQPRGTVLTLPHDQYFKQNFSEPLPLAAYTSTAYVSAFSGHPVFLEDKINLEILGIDYKGRLNLERDFIKVWDSSKKILNENNISYVYILKKQVNNLDEGKMGLKKIFENTEVQIYKTT